MENLKILSANIDETYGLLSSQLSQYIKESVKYFGEIIFSTDEAEEQGEIVPGIVYLDDYPEGKTAIRLYEEDGTIYLLADGEEPNSEIDVAINDLTVDEKYSIVHYIESVTLKTKSEDEG